MIVFDLKCAGAGHVFEAWFGSSGDYEDQRARGLLTCPICGDARIGKALMAPAIPAKGKARAVVPAATGPVAGETPDRAKMAAMMEKLATMQREVLKDSTWVGRGFAETARAMHYGEQDRASIHGEVAPAEAKALIDEGVSVAPLPFPVAPPEAQN